MDTFLKEPEHSKQLSDTMESHTFGSENSDTEDKDYSLSCGSSSFGNDEDFFQGEEMENDDEMEETATVIAEVGISLTSLSRIFLIRMDPYQKTKVEMRKTD